MTELRPGTSPPPVRIPMRFKRNQHHPNDCGEHSVLKKCDQFCLLHSFSSAGTSSLMRLLDISGQAPSSRQLVEQSPGLLQIERVEALGEPAVDRSEKSSGCVALTLSAPQPRHAHRRAQLEGLCLLLPSDRDGTLKICFRFYRIRLRCPQAAGGTDTHHQRYVDA